ncbi:MAG: hypothetical protein AAB975_02490 [Patescibacteria group bacterium]
MISAISGKERIDAVLFWKRHADNLRKTNVVSHEAITWVMTCTKPECIGFNSMEGEVIRPGEIGKWDMFEMARQGGFGTQECLLMADITVSQLAQEERREYMKDWGFDPDDSDEMQECERLEKMTAEELDAEIIRLRSLLAGQS